MAENIEKKQLKEITTEATKAYDATNKLQKVIGYINTALKKLDMGNLNKVSATLEKSGEAAKEATKNTSGLATAMEKLGQKMPNINSTVEKITQSVPNIKKVIEGISKKLPDIKKVMEDIYKATESTEEYFKSFNYYTDTFAEIASKWDKDFESYGSENAKRYANTFIQEMNESLGKLSGMKVSLSVDMESGTLTESGMKDLGLNAQEVTQFAAELASITNAMGQTGDVSLATADAFTKLAGDMSSYYNVDYGTVVNDLKNALLGQNDALSKYKVVLSDTKLQTYAYAYGLEKSVDEMTEAEKMQLSLIAILRGTEETWGNLADNINSPANSFRELTNNCKEVVSVFGQLFMPVLESLLPVMSGIVAGIKALLTSIAGFFGIEINIDNMGMETDDIATSVGDYSGTENNYSLGTGGSVNLADGILEEVARYEEAWNQAYENMDKKSQEWADKVTAFLEPVRSIFSNLAIGDYFSVGKNVGVLVISITDFLKKAIDSVDWHAVGEKIGEFIEGINWTEVFSSISELVGEVIGSAFEGIGGVIETAPLETGIVAAIGLIKWTGVEKAITSGDLFKSLATLFSGQLLEENGLFSKLGNVFALWTGGAGTLGESFMAVFGAGGVITVALAGLVVGLGIVFSKNEEVRKSFDDAVNSMKTGLQPMLEFLTNDLLPDLQDGWNGLLEIFKPFGDFLNTMFVSIWQDMLNPALEYLGTTVLPILTETLANLWNNVCVPFGEFIGSIFSPIIAVLSSGLTVLWENIIVPLANALGNILGKAFEGFCEILNGFIFPILDALIFALQFLWDMVLLPIAKGLVDVFGPAFEMAFESVGGIIDGLSKAFGGLIDFIAGSFSKDWEKTWSGIKDIFKGVFNGLISIVEGVVNFIIVYGINDFLKDLDGVVTNFGAVIGLDISIPQIEKISIPRFATGGFPEDGWFRASHGEIMGRFDNGQSVVANNMQITEGIAQGVREAVSGVLIPYLADIADSSRRTANKDFTVASRDVFEAVRAESSNYMRRTGELAFV
ncbi:MAG: hypothetical protein IJ455_06560 [Agathobacter sp.]|nr:hypothetical protein [Agathobacter sp.]